jgi:hypothetical protein
MQNQYGDRGFQYISVWSQNNMGGYPTAGQLLGWADSHGMQTVPALGLTSADESWSWYYEVDAYIPTYFILDRDMTVVAADTTNLNVSPYL